MERTRARGEQTRRELQALHHELDLLALDEGRADPPLSDPLDVSAEERDLEMTITLRKEWGLRLKMVEDEFDYECDLEGLPQFTGKMVSGFRRREDPKQDVCGVYDGCTVPTVSQKHRKKWEPPSRSAEAAERELKEREEELDNEEGEQICAADELHRGYLQGRPFNRPNKKWSYMHPSIGEDYFDEFLEAAMKTDEEALKDHPDEDLMNQLKKKETDAMAALRNAGYVYEFEYKEMQVFGRSSIQTRERREYGNLRDQIRQSRDVYLNKFRTMVEVCEGGLKVRSREPTSPGWTAYDQCRSYFCEHVFMSACSFDQEALRNNELRKQTFATYEQATEWQRGSGAPGAAKADERGSRAPKTRAAKDSGAPGQGVRMRLLLNKEGDVPQAVGMLCQSDLRRRLQGERHLVKQGGSTASAHLRGDWDGSDREDTYMKTPRHTLTAKRLHRGLVPILLGGAQRRLRPEDAERPPRGALLRVGARFEQQLHHRGVAVLRGRMERRHRPEASARAGLESLLRVGARLEQQLHHRSVALVSGRTETRLRHQAAGRADRDALLRVGARLEQQLDHRGVAFHRGRDERRTERDDSEHADRAAALRVEDLEQRCDLGIVSSHGRKQDVVIVHHKQESREYVERDERGAEPFHGATRHEQRERDGEVPDPRRRVRVHVVGVRLLSGGRPVTLVLLEAHLLLLGHRLIARVARHPSRRTSSVAMLRM